jgi:hypothetical protein
LLAVRDTRVPAFRYRLGSCPLQSVTLVTLVALLVVVTFAGLGGGDLPSRPE